MENIGCHNVYGTVTPRILCLCLYLGLIIIISPLSFSFGIILISMRVFLIFFFWWFKSLRIAFINAYGERISLHYVTKTPGNLEITKTTTTTTNQEETNEK